MRCRGVRNAILMMELALALTSALAAGCAWASDQAKVDATAQFLARHWAQPLAPQGEPPPGFAPVEASLAPEACGTCHAAEYADWRTSLHSRTMGAGILWQFQVLSQDESNGCLRCHAPLAEQKALTALQHKWANAPKAAMPAYVSGDLHLRGLVCAACHVRRHQRFGPPAKAQKATGEAARLPHNGFTAEPAFLDSRFCATCHQFPPQGRSLSGKLVENTYEEWRKSAAAAKGIACQGCHMPAKRHLWRGIHDREMVAKGVRRKLEVRRIDASHASVRATLTAPGVGHYFPTYVVPKVTISVLLQDADGTRVVARQVIGRTVSVDMDRELSDTRIPPGGESLVSAKVLMAPGANRIKMRVDVAPAEHYARMFQSMLDRNPKMDPGAQSILRQALREAIAADYRLDDLVVPTPKGFGESRRAIAN